MTSALEDLSNLNLVAPDSWARLSRKKIYFGHQSVGRDLLEGIGEIAKSFPTMTLELRETSSPADFDKPLFGHSLIGRNGDPRSKIDHFARLMENGLGDRVDLAFFKFCYVDIVAETDIEGVFSSYDERMADLRKKFPRVRFLTVTVPLTTPPAGLKAAVKKMLGMTLSAGMDNRKRNAFNALLREKFGRSLLDLAASEATPRNGEKAVFVNDGRTHGSLQPEYSDDGGHLNELGRNVVGSRFLAFLIDKIENMP